MSGPHMESLSHSLFIVNDHRGKHTCLLSFFCFGIPFPVIAGKAAITLFKGLGKCPAVREPVVKGHFAEIVVRVHHLPESILCPQVQKITFVTDIRVPLEHLGEIGGRKAKGFRHALQGDILVIVLFHVRGDPGKPV